MITASLGTNLLIVVVVYATTERIPHNFDSGGSSLAPSTARRALTTNSNFSSNLALSLPLIETTTYGFTHASYGRAKNIFYRLVCLIALLLLLLAPGDSPQEGVGGVIRMRTGGTTTTATPPRVERADKRKAKPAMRDKLKGGGACDVVLRK